MSFDTLAPYYRNLEWLTAGGRLQRSRTAFLPETRNCHRALLLGEGPGRFLPELLQINPGITVTCVESSARMIAEAQARLRHDQRTMHRVAFIHGDALQWPLSDNTFDLVVTHFFLDCFPAEEIEFLVTRVAAASTPGARWLLTDFAVPTVGWQRWRARILLSLMYAFFRFTTRLPARRLVSPEPFLMTAGFRRIECRLENCGFVQADLWERKAT